MKGTEWEKIILQFLFHNILLHDTYIVMVASHAATLRITYRYLHANERVRLAQRPPLLRPKKLDWFLQVKKSMIRNQSVQTSPVCEVESFLQYERTGLHVANTN